MRKIVLVTLVLLVVGVLALAQQGSNSQAPATSSSGQESAPQASSTETTVDGCLGGAAGNYTVTDKAGVSYKLQVAQDADSSALEKQVGHEVRVKGTLTASGSDAAPEAGAAASSQDPAGKAAKNQTIKVTAIDKIGDTCSEKAEVPPSKS